VRLELHDVIKNQGDRGRQHGEQDFLHDRRWLWAFIGPATEPEWEGFEVAKHGFEQVLLEANLEVIA
jgi:hypothetical protein